MDGFTMAVVWSGWTNRARASEVRFDGLRQSKHERTATRREKGEVSLPAARSAQPVLASPRSPRRSLTHKTHDAGRGACMHGWCTCLRPPRRTRSCPSARSPLAHHTRDRKMLTVVLQAASWSPLGVSRHPHGLLQHRHQRVIATEVSVLAQLDDLYRMLLVDGPIAIEYAPEQVADQLVGLATNRPVVGVHVTPAGWFGLALASLWTLYSPAGLVAYLRDARARGEELPMHLDWVPEHVWPQRQPEEAGGVQAETAAQATQTDDQAIR